MKKNGNGNTLWTLVFFALFPLVVTACASQTKDQQPDQTAPVTQTQPSQEEQDLEKIMMASDWRFHDIADVNFVKSHVTVPLPPNVMIIDSRPYQPKYAEGHIPNAVSIPDSKFDEMKDQLPKEKNTLLIFYCGGFDCRLSHKSAKKAEALGYTNVKVFAAGFPAWEKEPGTYACVSREFVEKAIEENRMVLVDSRPKKPKFDEGHIPTAISIPDSRFEELKGRLPADRKTLLVFYCEGFSCKLSHKSAAKALALGYDNVKVYAAGYPDWKKAHAQDPGSNTIAIKGGKVEGSIDMEVFKKITETHPPNVLLIDTRDKDEFAAAHLKNAVNMTVDELQKKIKTLPADKTVIFVCATGSRSGEAFYMVKDLRPDIKDVWYVEAGLKFNKDGSYEVKKTK